MSIKQAFAHSTTNIAPNLTIATHYDDTIARYIVTAIYWQDHISLMNATNIQVFLTNTVSEAVDKENEILEEYKTIQDTYFSGGKIYQAANVSSEDLVKEDIYIEGFVEKKPSIQQKFQFDTKINSDDTVTSQQMTDKIKLEVGIIYFCPICKAKMAKKLGKYGEFYSCIDYPTCKGKRNKWGEPSVPIYLPMPVKEQKNITKQDILDFRLKDIDND